VAVLPKQVWFVLLVTASVGIPVLTLIVITVDEIHPETPVPLSVYVVVVLGETVIVELLDPVLQVYEMAPDAVKRTLPPVQIAFTGAEIATGAPEGI